MKKLTLQLLVAAFFMLLRTAEGQTTFQETFGAGTGYSIKKTSDGNYVVTGESNNNAFLLKMDQNGNKLWFKSYGSSVSTVGNSVDVIFTFL